MNTRKLKKARLSESVEELKNPGRGWYQIHTFSAEKDFSREELGWCLGDGNTLALAFIDIGAYRERALDKTCLSNIGDILDCFEQNGRDVILRIAYDREGRAEEREPYSLSQVVEHLEQLGPVLSQHAEHIFVYQGLLVGSWGEMHSSRFITENRLERLADVLGKYLGGRTFLAVRRPVYWRMLHPDGKLDSHIKMGLFDDGIFGSDTHLGTFSRETAAEAGWGKAWRMEEELDFEEKLCVTAPQGGEALYEEGQAEKRSLAGTVERLKKMRISYLNCVYDRRILELWQQMTWEEKGPWNGVNGFDYIGRHLGYRFCVRNAKMTDTGEKKGTRAQCLWEIAVENTGFAPCYQQAEVWLEWEDSRGQICRKDLALELDRILPGEIRTGTCITDSVEGEFRLYAARKRDGRAICFANVPEGGKGVLLGRVV